MSSVSMNNLASLIHGFESMGDAPVAAANPAGVLGGRNIQEDRSAQAKAEAEILRNIIDTVRDTEGLGSAGAGLVERSFGNITSQGNPITGREVATALKAAVTGVVRELPPDEGARVLEEFATHMQSAPLHELNESNLPQNLEGLNPQQITGFVEQHTVDAPLPSLPPAPPHTAGQIRIAAALNEAVEDLQAFKEALGGSPNYGDRRPAYDTASETFFGLPKEACQAWSQKTIDQGWPPKVFWKAVGRAFGLGIPRSQYEKASLYIESLERIITNRTSLPQIFQEPDGGQKTFQSLTRLACHPEYQPANDRAGGLLRVVDGYLETFCALYADAKERGTLQQLFGALNGVCMEDRVARLQTYALANPIAAQNAAEAAVDLANVDNEKYTALETLSIKVGELSQRLGGDEHLTWENITEHLNETAIGLKCKGADGTPGSETITPEVIQASREALNEVLYLEL